MNRSSQSRIKLPKSKQVLAAGVAGVVGLMAIAAGGPLVGSPAAFAETRTVVGTTVTYDDQDPASVPWSTTVKQNVTRYGTLVLSLDAVEKAGIAKTGGTDQWGSPVPLSIWDQANQTIYRRNFTNASRPDPFSVSNNIGGQLGVWTYVSQSSAFSVTWNPAPGYIGYATPLPIQIDPARPEGQPSPRYHYATTKLPGKTTKPVASSGNLGDAQSAQASAGFQGVTDGPAWTEYPVTYAFQVDRSDAIAAQSSALDFVTDDNGNYVGYVTTELNTTEGRYIIDPNSGLVTFIPSNGFFTEGELNNDKLADKQATPIRVVVSNLTTHRFIGANNTMDYGQSRPAHTIADDNASYREVLTWYTPTVRKPNLLIRDAEAFGKLGRPVVVRPNYAQEAGEQPIDPLSITLLIPDGLAGATYDLDGNLTVAGQGKWVLNGGGTVTFFPEESFIGDPTPIWYGAKSKSGVPARLDKAADFITDNQPTLKVSYGSADGRFSTTYGLQGITQSSDDKAAMTGEKGDLGLTAEEMFPGYPTSWYTHFTYQLVDPDGQLVNGQSLTIDGQGTFTIDSSTGVVKFTPEKSFFGAGPVVGIRISNLKSANGQQAGADGHYRPIVAPVSADVLSAHATSPSIGAALDIKPVYKSEIDTSTITFVVPAGTPGTLSADGKQLTVPNEGVWTVNQDGKFTFTPQGLDVAGGAFMGSPTPVTYLAKNKQGVAATVPGQISAFYPTPDPRSAVTTNKPGVIQKSTDTAIQRLGHNEGLTAAGMFPVMKDAIWWNKSEFTLLKGDVETDRIAYPGQGTYEIDKATGVVSFTPEKDFFGKANSVDISIKNIQTINGQRISAKYTAVVDTVTDTGVPTLPDTKQTGATPGVSVQVTPEYPSTVDTTTIRIIDPDQDTDGKKKTIPGQGVWTVDDNGTFTFQPDDGFSGKSSISYTGKSTSGVTASEPATVIVEYNPPARGVPLPSAFERATAVGQVVNITPTYSAELDLGSIRIVGAPGAGKTLVVPGEGSWTVTDRGVFTFTPAPGFTADPTPIGYLASTREGVTATVPGQIVALYPSNCQPNGGGPSDPNPGQPSDPNPGKPGQPSDPNPGNPSDPKDPGQPYDPNPGRPGQPSDPNPEKPSTNPGQPKQGSKRALPRTGVQSVGLLGVLTSLVIGGAAGFRAARRKNASE